MSRRTITIEKVKQMDMVAVLATLGFDPAKVTRQQYWYLSPFRQEKRPSFKIDRTLNAWYDHGEGCGGNLLDFAVRYYQCSVKEVLQKFAERTSSPIFTKQQNPNVQNINAKISVINSRMIEHGALINYLKERRITLHIARQYCVEVDFTLYGKLYFAIGFRNSSGGYELRNAYYKGGASPKTPTFLDNHSRSIAVFEGCFDFLSYCTVFPSQQSLTSFLILNSLSFLQKQLPLLEQFEEIDLYLDLNDSGKRATQKLLEWSTKCRDRSLLYDRYEDLNEWHRHTA